MTANGLAAWVPSHAALDAIIDGVAAATPEFFAPAVRAMDPRLVYPALASVFGLPPTYEHCNRAWVTQRVEALPTGVLEALLTLCVWCLLASAVHDAARSLWRGRTTAAGLPRGGVASLAAAAWTEVRLVDDAAALLDVLRGFAASVPEDQVAALSVTVAAGTSATGRPVRVRACSWRSAEPELRSGDASVTYARLHGAAGDCAAAVRSHLAQDYGVGAAAVHRVRHCVWRGSDDVRAVAAAAAGPSAFPVKRRVVADGAVEAAALSATGVLYIVCSCA